MECACSVKQNKFNLKREETVGGYRDLMISAVFKDPKYVCVFGAHRIVVS